jgi:4a-hydroxytetrahydrobiopterin dehydratase
MPFVRVADAADIPADRTRFYRISGRPLVIAHRAGRFYALGGICPHQGNPLEGAILWDDLIDCPWHHFQYDIRTGENRYPKNVYPEGHAGAARTAPAASGVSTGTEGERNMGATRLKLAGDELRRRAEALPDWRVRDDRLAKTFVFPDFVTALAFVNRIGAAAEDQGHHPDVHLAWGRVNVEISTHDAGGITESDFTLAAEVDRQFLAR